MIVYTVTKLFGVDAVKTRVFKDRTAALEDIKETITLLVEDEEEVKVIEKENGEIYYIIHESTDPTAFLEIILRRNEVR